MFIPKRRFRNFDEFINALEGKRDFYEDSIQKIVERLKEMFPDEIKTIDKTEYKQWIKENESNWGKRIETYHLDKMTYGLTTKV